MSLCQIVELSNRYGKNPELVLAGGGNTSYKDKNDLYVKSSGSALSDITEAGFVKLCRAALTNVMGKAYTGTEAETEAAVLSGMMAARRPGEEHKRPSVEALLHALFPQTFVVHLHPAMANGITCSKEGKKAAKCIFGSDMLWIDEIKPGYTLAAAAEKAMADYKAQTGKVCNLLILQNHGVFFAADTKEAMEAHIDAVMAKIAAACTVCPDLSDSEADREAAAAAAPALRMIAADGAASFAAFRTNRAVLELCESKDSFKTVYGAFTPDHIVYCKHVPAYCAGGENLPAALSRTVTEYESNNGEKPKIVCVKGLGYFALGGSKNEADIAAAVFMDAVKIAFYARSFGGPRFMSPEMVSFIRNWEVESYRKKVALSADGTKRLAGKIAVITGGAQGFGLGIAEQMCAVGATVVIADLNAEGAQKAADGLCSRFGRGRAAAIACNVSDESSVAALCRETALNFGGIDVFVSNAGILRSGGLEDMDFKTFELMTKVNYCAYFLCVKYASRVMKIQHSYAPDRYFDIIQINSKSGLSGSNKNFAYAGGKFGGIGLTQSFALELVGENIKVNAICPGNFFDGPLWNDPEKGLFVQYLHAGKVPGAKTVDDVKKAYEAKVPMKRGCTVPDVARAIFYIIEQQYETGQAVPVTGGQNMLN